VSALRFLFVKTLRRHFLTEYIPFPKCPKRLPTVLSPEEVTRIINASPNLYHRTLLTTLYSTALRRAELCRLKVSDVDSQRMMIRIEQGKGRRDRYVPLSPKLLEILRVYWRWTKPKTFLFPGTVKAVRADVPISRGVGPGGAGTSTNCSRSFSIAAIPSSTAATSASLNGISWRSCTRLALPSSSCTCEECLGK
jgi:integrase/recombinase XerD